MNSLIIKNSIEVIAVIIIAIAANMLFRSSVKIPKMLQTRNGRKYLTIAQNIITLILVIFALHIIFLIFNINVTPLLASIGLIGVLTAIIANSVFSDLLAGFFLLSQINLTIGDYINVGGTNIAGTILSIGIKNLILQGDDGSTMIVPNGLVRTCITYPNNRINIFIDIQAKLNQPIDTILMTFRNVLEEFKKDANWPIGQESKIGGIRTIDRAGGIVTITSMIVTPISLRLKVDPEYRYRISKAFED